MSSTRVTVDQWTEMFRDIGLTDPDMHKWHHLFESRYPEGHQGFLEWLELPADRIADIRRKSAENFQ